MIASNGSLKDEFGNYGKEFVEVSLGTYYSIDYEVRDDFGYEFFDGWNKEEWNKFYNLMLYCVQLYLQGGLILLNQSTQ